MIIKMAREWTKAQTAAIEHRGTDLLVSAGAGSGKTAVLTERIIRRLTDRDNPAEITRMLIVTFTKAAAGELKERIASAIESALAENPGNKRLSRQLPALDRAKICTIHSFCLDVLKEHGGSELIPADFRIADETEITLLRKGIMNNLIEKLYSDSADIKIDGFEDFADMFVGTKSDNELADIFLGIEKALSSYPEHIEFIKRTADYLANYDGDFAATPYAKEILSYVSGKFDRYRNIFADVLSEITSDEKLNKAYYPPFTNDIDFIDSVNAAIDSENFENICAAFRAFSPVRLGVVRNAELSSELEYAKEMRGEFHDERKEFAAKYFSLSPEALNKNCKATAIALNKLYTILRTFCDQFAGEKKRRAIVDFSDLERLTYELLVSSDSPAPAALALRDSFDEVYIDEYQDVNAVQDGIFAAVSRGDNRFMVGDIKQSIYAFRGSDPMIFADYRRRFSSPDENGTAIFLSANFRCDKNIIDFSNIVSLCLFTSGRGDVDFREEDMLVHGKLGDENGEPVHIVLIDDSDSESEDEISSKEAMYIARESARLIKEGKKNDGSPIRPSDIAVLMRSTKAHATALSEAFDSVGIPYFNNVKGEFFENAEVLLALSIINIIDNPTRDIYLAGALRSPIFGFTLSDLIRVRKFTPEGSLYSALAALCEAEDFPKGRYFLDKLSMWQRKAAGMRVDRLLWYIYTDTDLLALVYDKENAAKRANLMLLYEYARRFEASSFKGLYNFIRYINDILEEKAELETAKVFGESSDTVKLMSIHQSKGLEFPVCFICGTGKKFNDNDLRRNIVMDKSLGISLKLSDETGFARYDTVIRQSILRRISDSQLEEEMRILYVAMTRARERLYVTALAKEPQKLLDSAYADSLHLSRDSIMKNRGYMHWILTAAERHKRISPDSALPFEISVMGTDEVPMDIGETEAESEIKESTESTDFSALVRERFDFKYPSPSAAKLPAKLSVSKLYPGVLDEDAGEELAIAEEKYSFAERRPLFLDGNTSELPASGTERGTATHTFMQFCDFSLFSKNDTPEALAEKIEREAERLAERKFITKRASKLINIKKIAGFFGSELFSGIKASPSVFREKRFNVFLPASDFTTDKSLAEEISGETILVQGVIDCFFENPDGTLTLLDYKTDYIRDGMTKENAAKLLTERYYLQLSYYRAALEKISMKKVSRTVIYSFGGGYEIEI